MVERGDAAIEPAMVHVERLRLRVPAGSSPERLGLAVAHALAEGIGEETLLPDGQPLTRDVRDVTARVSSRDRETLDAAQLADAALRQVLSAAGAARTTEGTPS